MVVEANVRLVTRFNFDDERTGKKIAGTKIYYDGEQVSGDEKKGIELLTLTSDNYNSFNDFPVVPAKYSLDFSLVPGSKGTVKMKYVSAKLLDRKTA